MVNETEQRGLLAYHTAQRSAAQDTMDLYVRDLATSGNPDQLAAKIAEQQAVIEREQARIDDCLRNLGELSGDAPAVEVPAVIAEPVAIEETPVEETSEDEPAETPKRSRRG